MGRFVYNDKTGLTSCFDELGRLHRIDGPALFGREAERWFFEGVPHREFGPAFSSPWSQKYYHYGQLHRTDGPAVIMYTRYDENTGNYDGLQEEWYLYGVYKTWEDVARWNWRQGFEGTALAIVTEYINKRS